MVEVSQELEPTLTVPSPTSPINHPTHNVRMPWGRLTPYESSPLQAVDLFDAKFTLGRSEDCNIVIYKDKFFASRFQTISGVHFVLYKEPDGPVYITDLSKNGTYLNQVLIGKEKTNILQNGDVISIGGQSQKVYLFISHFNIDEYYLPEELRKRYQIWTSLGKGAAGEVRLAYEKISCKKYAIKKITKSNSSNVYQINHSTKIKTEIRILRRLRHPCIVGMKEIVDTETDVFIVLEYMEGGELTSRILSINSMSESNIKHIFYQIVLAVKHLHMNGVAHRDLKPENVLLLNDDNETLVKLSDFGLSKIMNDDFMTTLCGTLNYIAPEILNGAVRYNQQVDVWSLGVILYYMISTEFPFCEKEGRNLRQIILNGNYVFNEKKFNKVSLMARDLIRQMLVVNPARRITVDNILKHPWIAKDKTVKLKVRDLLHKHYKRLLPIIDDSSTDSSDTDTVDNSEDDDSETRPLKKLCTLTNSVTLDTRL